MWSWCAHRSCHVDVHLRDSSLGFSAFWRILEADISWPEIKGMAFPLGPGHIGTVTFQRWFLLRWDWDCWIVSQWPSMPSRFKFSEVKGSSSEGFGHDTTPQSWKLKNMSQVSLDLLSVSLEYTWIYKCLFTEIESWIFMDGKWGKLGFPQLIIHVVIRNTQPSSSRWGQEWPRVSPGSSSCRSWSSQSSWSTARNVYSSERCNGSMLRSRSCLSHYGWTDLGDEDLPLSGDVESFLSQICVFKILQLGTDISGIAF